MQEPEFFSKGCKSQPSRCPEPKQGYYLRHTLKLEEAVAANLTKATFEGSTHYAEVWRPGVAAHAPLHVTAVSTAGGAARTALHCGHMHTHC